jgi:integrase
LWIEITNKVSGAARLKGDNGKPEKILLPISAGTVWCELLRLRSCVNWAWDHNRLRSLGLDAKPKVWVPRKPEPRKRVLSVEEFVRLCDARANTSHMRHFVILAITTAGRFEAFVQLRRAKVSLAASTIDLRGEPGEVNPLNKRSRKGRTVVPMTAEARVALLQTKDDALTDHVIEWDGSPVRCCRGAARDWGGWEDDPTRPGKQRWVTDVTPQVLRHTAPTWLEDAGTNRDDFKATAHSGPDITRQFNLHARPEVLGPATEARRLQQHDVRRASVRRSVRRTEGHFVKWRLKLKSWWAVRELNPRHLRCKRSAPLSNPCICRVFETPSDTMIWVCSRSLGPFSVQRPEEHFVFDFAA